MTVNLDIKLPDKLRPMFDQRERLVVPDDLEGHGRDAALLWLWSRTGSRLWLGADARAARERLRELLAAYPKLLRGIDAVNFERQASPRTYDYAVIIGDTTGPVMSARLETRIIEQTPVVIRRRDFVGVTLEEQLLLLARTRAGQDTGYNEQELLDSVTSASLYEFIREYWSEIIPETLVDNWHIRYLCDEIQRVFERVFVDQLKLYDLVINISPGESKSTVASVFSAPWAWKRMPSLRLIGGSYKHTLAADLSRKARDVVMSRKYQQCTPMTLKEDQNAKDYFVNDSGGMRLAIGTGGVAGFHGHVIVIDDPLDPNKSASAAEIKAANEWICRTLAQRKIDQAKTPMILIMQRLHQSDPTAEMLKRSMMDGGATVRHICLPAEESEDIRPPELRARYVDGLMDPLRLSRKTLAEKKAQGQFFYSGQYMQRPSPLEGGMFKWERLNYDQPPLELKEWLHVVRYWDKAGTQGDGARTAGVKMGLDHRGRFWVLDVVKGQWDSGRREDVIKKTAEFDGRGVEVGVEQEPGSGGKQSAEETAKMLAGFRVRVDRPTGDKALRADSFSVQVNNGNVYVRPATWNIDYIDELQYFPNSTFKDQVDASSGAFKMLAKSELKVERL